MAEDLRRPLPRWSGLWLVATHAMCVPFISSADAEDRRSGPVPPFETFEEDFRGPSLPTEWLKFSAALPAENLKLTRKGLRMHLGGGQAAPISGGVQFLARICGDFEITGTFEIIDVQQPGWGAGLSLSLSGSKGESVRLERIRLRQDGDVYAAHRALPPGHEAPLQRVEVLPASSPMGRLRIQREGTTLICSASSAHSGPFEELLQAEFSGEDVSEVQFASQAGDSQNKVDVLWKSVRVRAESLVHPASVDFVEPTRFPGRLFWSLWLAVPATVGIVWGLSATISSRFRIS